MRDQQENGQQDAAGPCGDFVHDHPPVRNVNVEFEKKLGMGQVIADRVAAAVGSWPFIIVQSVILVAWIAANLYLVTRAVLHPGGLKAWDPYPFILLNLVLSFQAAYTGPVVMMSQNRQAEKDRLTAQQDFEVNRKAEEEIEVIMRHLLYQDEQIRKMSAQLDALVGRAADATRQ
jgi:uncharacterized membrane protein